MAQPQSDQYDTEAVLRRAPSEHSPGRGARPAPGAGALICDGAVTVQTTIQGLMSPPRYVDAVVDHPNLPLAADLLRHWPAAYQQFKRLIDTVHPLCDTTITVARRAVHLGASSGSDEARLGTICVTVDCVLGLAQAMVQQMAHQKLRALDISDARASRFIQNDLEMRVTSPFHGGAKHTIAELFHAQYAFVHVTCLDVHLLRQLGDTEARERLLMLLARNVPRIEAGMEALDRHLQTDADGARFSGAFRAWTGEVIRDGNQILDTHGYGMPPLGA